MLSVVFCFVDSNVTGVLPQSQHRQHCLVISNLVVEQHRPCQLQSRIELDGAHRFGVCCGSGGFSEADLSEPKAYDIDSSAELSLSTDSCVEVIPAVSCPLLDPIGTSPKNADGDMTNNDGDGCASRAKTETQQST